MKVKDITYIGLFAALIFTFTYTFKIPSITGLGYAHLGDMFILVSVWVLGRKKAPLAAGLGAALSDIVSGFAVWALPTFIIKFCFATIIGLIAEKAFNEKYLGYLVGSLVGAAFHILGYFLVWNIIGGGIEAAVATLPTLSGQTLFGFIAGNIVIFTLSRSSFGRQTKAKARA